MQERAKRLKHPNIPRRVYENDIAPSIGKLPIAQVTPRDIRRVIQTIANDGRPCVSNDALMYCKQLFRHAIKLDLRDTNPAEAFDLHDAGGVEKSRNRALAIEEVKSLFAVFDENTDQFSRENYLAIALLLVLGVRKIELVGAEWNEMDLENGYWDLPQERSKMGEPIRIPLPSQVVTWFKELRVRSAGSQYVFPRRRTRHEVGHMSHDTLNAALQKLFKQEKLDIPHFVVHDLRRTCRSFLASEGVPAHVAERCLNHKIKGVEGVYDRYDYFEERKAALQIVADKVAPCVKQFSC